MAIAIFMGLCVLGMLFLLWFLVVLFKESTSMGGSYVVQIGAEQAGPSGMYPARTSSARGTSAHAA